MKNFKKAQSLIEYTLILILISLIAVTTLHFLGKKIYSENNIPETNSKQNITETMTQYCQIKGLSYNENTERCEIPKNNSDTKKQ